MSVLILRTGCDVGFKFPPVTPDCLLHLCSVLQGVGQWTLCFFHITYSRVTVTLSSRCNWKQQKTLIWPRRAQTWVAPTLLSRPDVWRRPGLCWWCDFLRDDLCSLCVEHELCARHSTVHFALTQHLISFHTGKPEIILDVRLQTR